MNQYLKDYALSAVVVAAPLVAVVAGVGVLALVANVGSVVGVVVAAGVVAGAVLSTVVAAAGAAGGDHFKPVAAFLVGSAATAIAFALTASLKGNDPPAAPIVEQAPLVQKFNGVRDGRARIEQQAKELHLLMPKGYAVKPS